MTKRERIRAAEDAYFKKILGFEYEEVKTIDEYDENKELSKRKTETTRKYSPPDCAALLAFLKTSCPEKWDSSPKKEEQSDSGVIILPEVEELE